MKGTLLAVQVLSTLVLVFASGIPPEILAPILLKEGLLHSGSHLDLLSSGSYLHGSERLHGGILADDLSELYGEGKLLHAGLDKPSIIGGLYGGELLHAGLDKHAVAIEKQPVIIKDVKVIPPPVPVVKFVKFIRKSSIGGPLGAYGGGHHVGGHGYGGHQVGDHGYGGHQVSGHGYGGHHGGHGTPIHIEHLTAHGPEGFGHHGGIGLGGHGIHGKIGLGGHSLGGLSLSGHGLLGGLSLGGHGLLGGHHISLGGGHGHPSLSLGSLHGGHY